MLWILALATAGSTALIVEWAQRHCEQWALVRDREL